MIDPESAGVALARNAFHHELADVNGIMVISTDRPFAHDETDYDTQYELNELDIQPGRRLTELLVEQGVTAGANVLEIGCGTGLLSVGLAASNFYGDLVITDGSMRFMQITQRKMREVKSTSRICLALLTDADMDSVAEHRFDVIAMRSVLHHITDFSPFALNLLSKLKPGGVLALYEPRAELFLWMGTLAALLPDVARARGMEFTDEERSHLRLFVDTMKFYLRRDIDKSEGEDKYAFWATEMLDIGAQGHARTVFRSESNPDDLVKTLLDYMQFCMSFPPELVDKISSSLSDLRAMIIDSLRGSAAPDLAGWYLMTKERTP